MHIAFLEWGHLTRRPVLGAHTVARGHERLERVVVDGGVVDGEQRRGLGRVRGAVHVEGRVVAQDAFGPKARLGRGRHQASPHRRLRNDPGHVAHGRDGVGRLRLLRRDQVVIGKGELGLAGRRSRDKTAMCERGAAPADVSHLAVSALQSPQGFSF